MKVLHLVSGDLTGGAARGALWLHNGLKAQGVASSILTNGKRHIHDSSIENLPRYSVMWAKAILASRFAKLWLLPYINREPQYFSTGFDGIDITKHPAYELADIIHLHWISGLVSVKSLKDIRKPVVWTLRDLWPFTGGCHYPIKDCSRYESACGACPLLGSTQTQDLSRMILERKKLYLPKNLHLVGVSDWVSSCAKQSFLFKTFPVHTIQNCVDIAEFTSFDRSYSRQRLGLPVNGKIILAGATSFKQAYKGTDLLIEALKKVNLIGHGAKILLFGESSNVVSEHFPETSINLGYLNSNEALSLAYAAADVFVIPSRHEAFGKTAVESLLCGTPVVCFDSSGPSEIIEHQITGYTAKSYDTSDLAAGIEGVLGMSASDSREMRLRSRKYAQEHFASSLAAIKYKDLYQSIL
jgi:glycosyltransferase involved in cell wall biosynthesis